MGREEEYQSRGQGNRTLLRGTVSCVLLYFSCISVLFALPSAFLISRLFHTRLHSSFPPLSILTLKSFHYYLSTQTLTVNRSTGYAALSIWTHNLRSISYQPTFSPTSCPSTYTGPAVRIAAGHTSLEVQSYLSNYSSIIVTGGNPSVGLIGWLTGGGHGLLSSSYGMGADNLLEASIVLPSGHILLANSCVHPDLFFAIRGGGGGTFGVVTEIVVKAFPSPKTTMHTFKLAALSPNTTTQFWVLMGFIHAQMADLKAGGMQGYYFLVGPPAYPTLAFLWVFYLYDKPVGTVEKLISPIVKRLEEEKGVFGYESEITHTDTYWESWGEIFSNELVANGGSAYGSRLMSPESLSDPNETAKVFEEIGPSVGKPNVRLPFLLRYFSCN
jgi:hypothetical protein